MSHYAVSMALDPQPARLPVSVDNTFLSHSCKEVLLFSAGKSEKCGAPHRETKELRKAMNTVSKRLLCLLTISFSTPLWALSLAPEEFQASRQMACVLAEQSLGYLSEDDYGARTHNVLNGFEESERSNILAKALGYYDGLMFEIAGDDTAAVNRRLEQFVASSSCQDNYRAVTHSL